MLDKSVLMSGVIYLKEIVSDKYLAHGNVIELLQPGKDSLNILNIDVDSMLLILENWIRDIIKLVNSGKFTDDDKIWLESIFETELDRFKLFCKRIENLEQLANKYPDEYQDILIRLYTNLVMKLVSKYIEAIKNNKEGVTLIKVGGLNLE